MNKAQGGAIGGGIAVVIIIAVIVTIFASGGSIASDSPEISENVMLDEEGPGGDSEGVDFFIDEEGKKTYIIEASDSPGIGE